MLDSIRTVAVVEAGSAERCEPLSALADLVTTGPKLALDATSPKLDLALDAAESEDLHVGPPDEADPDDEPDADFGAAGRPEEVGE